MERKKKGLVILLTLVYFVNLVASTTTPTYVDDIGYFSSYLTYYTNGNVKSAMVAQKNEYAYCLDDGTTGWGNKCKYTNATLIFNLTDSFVVYNVSNLSYKHVNITFDKYGTNIYVDGIKDVWSSENVSYKYNRIVGGIFNRTICSEGKCNIFRLNLPYYIIYSSPLYTGSYTVASSYDLRSYGDTLLHQSSIGNSYSSTGYNLHPISMKVNSSDFYLSSVSTYGTIIIPQIPYKLDPIFHLKHKVLDPTGLNTAIYIKNHNGNNFAISVKYNGEEYFLTVGDYDMELMYSDLGLVHYVYCAPPDEMPPIWDTSQRTTVLIQQVAPNYVLDVDSICGSQQSVNMNETMNQTINIFANTSCGIVNRTEVGNDTIYIEGENYNSNSTIYVNVIYANGSAYTFIETRHYQLNFTKSNVKSISITCHSLPNIYLPDVNYTEISTNGGTTYVLWKWENKDVFVRLTPITRFILYFAVILVIPFIVGRSLLGSIIGYVGIGIFLYYVHFITWQGLAIFVIAGGIIAWLTRKWSI